MTTEATDMPQAVPAVGAQVERGVRRHPLEVECLYTDDTKTLMSKGHHDPAEFRKACEFWNGGPLDGWGGKIRHAWGRTVPDSSGDYEFLMLPAKPHARGAYPVTTIIDDAAYDHDDGGSAPHRLRAGLTHATRRKRSQQQYGRPRL